MLIFVNFAFQSILKHERRLSLRSGFTNTPTMFRTTCITMLLLVFAFQVQAQFKGGLRAGLSTTELEPADLLVMNSQHAQDLVVSLENANYGFHFGLFAQIKMSKFFIQPEVLYNAYSVDFRVEGNQSGNPLNNIRRETYRHIDIPFMLGFKFGPLRLQGGPVGHYFLNSDTQLSDIEGYMPEFDNLTFGYQAGIGIDVWKLLFDFKYEGSFNRFGEHINIHGQQYAFDQRPGRLIFSLGYAFGKNK